MVDKSPHKSEGYWNHVRNLSLKSQTMKEDMCKTHGPKTLVYGWYMGQSALPYDNDIIKNPKLSAYKRLGTHAEPFPTKSVSQEFAHIAANTKVYQRNVHRPMMNIITFPTTIGKAREEAFKLSGLVQQHPNCNRTEYISVTMKDFTCPNPMKHKIIPKECHKVETKYRRINTDPLTALRDGMRKFLDDDIQSLMLFKDRSRGPYPYAFNTHL